jgi:hypothetical protein
MLNFKINFYSYRRKREHSQSFNRAEKCALYIFLKFKNQRV